MNINDVNVTAPYNSSIAFWSSFLEERGKIFHGFCEVEKHNGGLLYPGIALSSAKGQEALRILFFRVIEEYAESMDSSEKSHILEELADAMNYLLSIPFLDLKVVDVKRLAERIDMACWDLGTFEGSSTSLSELGSISFMFGMRVGDLLRNRTWTKNAQDVVFNGSAELMDILIEVLKLLIAPFHDFNELAWFLLAKHEVLKFRLRTNY